MYEVIIVGAGPAGLSAALILGRCRRHVLVCDTGEYRNDASHALHGFLSRDGVSPGELRQLGREQLRQYETVELRRVRAVDAALRERRFEVTLEDGSRLETRKLLLATGVYDELPPLAGAEEFYGRGVHHCPYCDGWELRDQPLAIYGGEKHGRKLALELRQWSANLTLCTNGPAKLPGRERERLRRNRIALREERIARLEGKEHLERLVFENGETLSCCALFFKGAEHQRSDLAARLGCDFTKRGAVRTGEYEATDLPGLFVAGDASHRVQLAIIAAAEGAAAAYAINMSLIKEDLP
jgi:thioredoxin reductase